MRKKALCCSPNQAAYDYKCVQPLLCDYYPELCLADGYNAAGYWKRDGAGQLEGEDATHELERRGSRNVQAMIPDPAVDFIAALVPVISMIYHLVARPYPGPATLYDGANGAHSYPNAFRLPAGSCSQTGMQQVPAANGAMAAPNSQPESYQNDHPVELTYLARFIETATTGLLSDGHTALTTTQRIPAGIFFPLWEDAALFGPNDLRQPAPRANPDWYRWSLHNRLYEILGSSFNREPFRMLPASLNGMKGRIFAGHSPVHNATWRGYLQHSTDTGTNAEAFLEPLRQTVAIYRYMHDPDVNDVIQATRRRVRGQLLDAAAAVPALAPLVPIWQEFDPFYFRHVAALTRQWLMDRLIEALDAWEAARQRPVGQGMFVPTQAQFDQIWSELRSLVAQLGEIREFAAPGVDQQGD